jgi:hypothetical protein
MHNPMANEVPFPLAGEGAVLRFRTGDLVRLRGKYGAPLNEPPKYDDRGRRIDFFWQVIIVGVESQDPAVVTDCLRIGLKQADGKTPLELDWEDLPFPLQAAEAELLDALFLARWGKSASQLAEDMRKAAEEAAENADPLASPEMDETSSTDSSGLDTEPA